MSYASLKKCSFTFFCRLQSETSCRNMASSQQQSMVGQSETSCRNMVSSQQQSMGGQSIKVCKAELPDIAFRSLIFMCAKVGLW